MNHKHFRLFLFLAENRPKMYLYEAFYQCTVKNSVSFLVKNVQNSFAHEKWALLFTIMMQFLVDWKKSHCAQLNGLELMNFCAGRIIVVATFSVYVDMQHTCNRGGVGPHKLFRCICFQKHVWIFSGASSCL